MRLAERQGLLTGKHLSSAQSLALEMLMLLDHKMTGERFISDMKSRIVAAHPSEFPLLFPEWISRSAGSKEEMDKSRREDGTYDIDKIDGSKIEWSVPTEGENEENERWIAERIAATGTVSAVELENGGWM